MIRIENFDLLIPSGISYGGHVKVKYVQFIKKFTLISEFFWS